MNFWTTGRVTLRLEIPPIKTRSKIDSTENLGWKRGSSRFSPECRYSYSKIPCDRPKGSATLEVFVLFEGHENAMVRLAHLESNEHSELQPAPQH